MSYRPPRVSAREAMREESRQFRLRMAAQHGDRGAQRKTVLAYLARKEGRAA